MADGDSSLASMLVEASRRDVTKVVVAVDLTRGYDEADGEQRCSCVATLGTRGNIVAVSRGHSVEEAMESTLDELGALA